MKQLNKLQSIIFLVGGVLMVIGAGCNVFMILTDIVPWVFLVGAVMFSMMQIHQHYDGNNFTIRRLRRIMLTADILFVLAGMLMIDTHYQLLRSYFSDYFVYYQYVYNKWVIMLLAGAILEMYSMHRISSELKKEEKNAKSECN
jgi:hypothetical protein